MQDDTARGCGDVALRDCTDGPGGYVPQRKKRGGEFSRGGDDRGREYDRGGCDFTPKTMEHTPKTMEHTPKTMIVRCDCELYHDVSISYTIGFK